MEKARPKLKVISKYGIGVDKIDVKSCTEFGIPVLFMLSVNHTTVAEHTFLLLLTLEKNFLFHADSTRSGGWKRKTGHELFEKTIGIIGLGPRRQGGCHPRARFRHERPRLKPRSWDETFAAGTRSRKQHARRVACRQRLHFIAREPHALRRAV